MDDKDVVITYIEGTTELFRDVENITYGDYWVTLTILRMKDHYINIRCESIIKIENKGF